MSFWRKQIVEKDDVDFKERDWGKETSSLKIVESLKLIKQTQRRGDEAEPLNFIIRKRKVEIEFVIIDQAESNHNQKAPVLVRRDKEGVE